MMRLSYQGWGGDSYPGSTPQYENDHKPLEEPWIHDEPDYQPHDGEFNFFLANGELHVSPHHDHDELRQHAGVGKDHNGPMAVGRVSVSDGNATWAVKSTIGLRNATSAFQEYCRNVGWKWHGLTTLGGEAVDDRFAPTASFYFVEREGHVYLSHRRDALSKYGRASKITLAGRTAYAERWKITQGLRDWAADTGFKLAEYPGGSDMLDQLYKQEDLEQYNLGESAQGSLPTHKQPTGVWKCPQCEQLFPDFHAYRNHRSEEEPMGDEPMAEDGKFPELNMDATLPPHYHERFPVTMPLASVKIARTIEGFEDYASLWGFDTDEGHRHYGAFLDGFPVGYATVRLGATPELVMVHSSRGRRGVGTALVRTVQSHFTSLVTGVVSERGGRLVAKCGFVEVRPGIMKWAVGQDPKDILEAAVPFVYDVDKDTIAFGQPGQRTSDIQGEFTPGGIVEGEYQPGGKVVLTTDTSIPYTVRHFIDLFYWMHPQMEVTSVERQVGQQTVKLAATDVGGYIKTLAASDPAVWNAFQALRGEGGEVHVVGGAVRDALLQKEPKDIDLMVSGIPPAKVEHILNQLPGKVDLTGKDFGVFRYRSRGHEVEIALPRTERSTGDRRVDFDVSVDHKLPVEDDLLRRDFTANAMAVDLSSGRLVDPFGGAKDIDDRVLKTVHPSSFEEDPTRIVRGLVASSRHGLTPDERTRQEMAANAHRVGVESPERIQAELDKLFKTSNPAGAIRLAQDTGVLHHIFPEVAHNFNFDQNNPHHSYTLGDHQLNVLENVSRETTDPDMRLAALLHDVGKPASAWTNPETGFNHYYRGPNGEGADHAVVGATMADSRMRALKYPTARIKRVQHLIHHHMFPAFSSPKGARKFIQRVGDEHANDLLTLRWADQHGKGQSPSELATRTTVDAQRGLVEQVRSKQEPTTQNGLAINGKDLMQMGVPQGPAIGEILRYLLDEVVSEPQLNQRDQLMQMAAEFAAARPQ